MKTIGGNTEQRRIKRRKSREKEETVRIEFSTGTIMKEKIELTAQICGVSTSFLIDKILRGYFMTLYYITKLYNIKEKEKDIINLLEIVPEENLDPKTVLPLEDKKDRGINSTDLVPGLDSSNPPNPPIAPPPPSPPKERKRGDPRVKELSLWWFSEFERCMKYEYPFKMVKKEYVKINTQMKYALRIVNDCPRLKRTITIFHENSFVTIGLLWAEDMPRSRVVGVWYAWLKSKILDNPEFPDGEQTAKGGLPPLVKTTGRILEREIDWGGRKRKAAMKAKTGGDTNGK